MWAASYITEAFSLVTANGVEILPLWKFLINNMKNASRAKCGEVLGVKRKGKERKEKERKEKEKGKEKGKTESAARD